MKQVTLSFGVELDWFAGYANQLGAEIQGNNLMLGGDLFEGIRFAYKMNENISFLINDSVYKEDIHFKVRNKQTDFVEIHYNLSESMGKFYLDTRATLVGRTTYNLAILDSTINGDYVVKKGVRSFILSIFIKKTAYLAYLHQMDGYQDILDTIFNTDFNTVVRCDRMSNRSWWLINELRKLPVYGDLYSYFCCGTVYQLLAEYMLQLKRGKIEIEKLTHTDIESIFSAQMYLGTILKGAFPGIEALAEEALMSPTKFKKLFKKMTSQSPRSFFLYNKLAAAKEMLEKGGVNITEVADEYGFANSAHFSELFKTVYNITPKEYVNLLK